MNTTAPLASYHGDPAVKAKFLSRVQIHKEADRLIQGYGYWVDGKGCAVGCTLEVNTDAHAQYPVQLGLPEWLAHLEDHLFENLPVEDAREWPQQFLEAIPTGVSEDALAKVRDRFQIFWLERQKTQIDPAKYSQVAKAIDGVIALLQSAVGGTEPESAAWSADESAAWSAARSARHDEARVKRDWLLAELKSLK